MRIPPFLAAFPRRFPQVELNLTTGPSGELIGAVLEGQLAGLFVASCTKPPPHVRRYKQTDV
jgi:DNA-binding transcriptional LysR family regulator